MTKILATHGNLELTQLDPSGEVVVRDSCRQASSVGLSHSEVEQIVAEPGLMLDVELVADVDAVANEDDVDSMDETQCQCGVAIGESCSGELGADAVTIEWMPDALRASHQAASNAGVWPDNGALRLRVTPECARHLERHDGRWTHRV